MTTTDVRPHSSREDGRARPIQLAALAVLAAATGLMLAGIEPIASWYYGFAWYPTIAIVDAWAHRRRPARPMLLLQPRVFASLLLWSAVVWLFFELCNLRIANWYYVNVPDSLMLRRLGVVLAFGTVLPGIFALTRLLETYSIGDGWRWRRLQLPGWVPRALIATGVVWALLVLLWPGIFYPLVWGVAVLVLVPWNERQSGEGLLADVRDGRPGRIIRLLLAGLIAGLLWELFNAEAGSKWIYTVPGFEELKLFEMPLLGFLGFPPFALECFVMYRALVLAGVAVPWEPEPERRRAGVVSWVAAGVLGGAILLVTPPLMDHYTVDSRAARFHALPAITFDVEKEFDAHDLHTWKELDAYLEAEGVGIELGLPSKWLAELRGQVKLARLRGIGAANVARLVGVGVGNVEELAGSDPTVLAARLAAAHPERHHVPSRQRVWVRAARARLEAAGRDRAVDTAAP